MPTSGDDTTAGAGETGDAAERDPTERDPAERRRLLSRLATPAGLCATCVHLRLLASPRSVFVRCGLAATDPAFPRYPALPVTSCAGYRPLPEQPQGSGSSAVAGEAPAGR
jgi:hypothetical protein